MAQQTINVGAAPNDGTGTPLRTAFQYTNSNFSELYTAVGPSGNNIVVPGTATITGDLTVDTSTLKVDSTNNRVGIVNASPTYPLDVVGTGRFVQTDFVDNIFRLSTGGSTTGNINQILFANQATTATSAITAYNSLYGSGKNYALGFTTNGSERYLIDSTGISTWSVGGTTAMTLNSTGLGIGTSPSYNIDVLAATLPTISVRSTLAGASNARLYLECAGANSGHITYNRSLQALQLGANGGTTAQVTLDSSGRLLVGSTSAFTDLTGSKEVKIGDGGMQTLTVASLPAATATDIARGGVGGLVYVGGYNGTGQYGAVVLWTAASATVVSVINGTGSTITFSVVSGYLKITSSLALTQVTAACIRI